MREWGKRSFCLVCMFLVLTGMPVTVQAADYDGGTGSSVFINCGRGLDITGELPI